MAGNLKKFYHYSDAFLVAPDGRFLLGTTESGSQLHDHASELLKMAMKTRKPVLTDLHTGNVEARPHISVIAPVLPKDQTRWDPVAAVVLVNDARRFLFPLIQTWPVPSETAETLLIEVSVATCFF